ncbi:MAG: acetylglutamate kinase [Cyclobacteriaceae bacterium]
MEIKVVKIGGNVINDEAKLYQFLKDFASISGPKVLVHGGGKVASELAQSIGLEVKMVEGRRVTDEKMLDVVTMVYAGLLNKKIVANLQALNCNALGLSGADGNTIQSHKRTGSSLDYGFVGDVDEVNDSLLHQLIEQGVIPVFSAITHDKKGQLLNTNADTIASSVATGLSEKANVQLVYCFELPGVLTDINNHSSVIPVINKEAYRQYKEQGVIADGMIPKLDNCFSAISKGVKSVAICQAEKVNELVEGTFTLIA